MKATLYDGSYHPVDSSEMAFKMATILAFKKGFMDASPVLLEPIVSMKVTVPDKFTGDVMGDLNKRRGRVLGMTPDHQGNTIIEADVPQLQIYPLCLLLLRFLLPEYLQEPARSVQIHRRILRFHLS